MNERISVQEFSKLPFLRHIPEDDRAISLQTYFDVSTRDWYLYVPTAGELVRVAGGEVISGSYYSVASADAARDFEFPLATLVNTRLSFPDVVGALPLLESDLHRCAAVLEKFHLFSTLSKSDSLRAGLLVISEFEYLLLLLRSLYDQLQFVVGNIATRIVFVKGDNRIGTNRLKTSFADVALSGHEPRAIEEIEARWRLPTSLASWYHDEAPFFLVLRTLRDDIAHRGMSDPPVFRSEWGFAIDPANAPWNRFDEWPSEQRWNGRFGALRKIFARLIDHTLSATTRFANAISSSVQLPKSINENLRSYVRSPIGHHLVNLKAILEQPWEHRDAGTS